MADRTNAKEIFIGALDHPEPERGAYLAGACGNDSALRLEVEELLAALADRPVLDTAPYRVGRSESPEAAQGEGPGTRIGRYKLLQLIGEGGFGAVFMAEQERPVRRRVALKIIKLGMDTRQVVARFEQERQALAMMDHPHIAKVLDAGATQTGRPYFVMELVRGDPITAYCDTNNLAHAERLALFVQVCNAVQHAHQKGIIHRDLKPSNILITVADGRPIPKVIDFGIAKATGAAGRLTDKTLFTEFRQLIGTPEYMSPEQAEMSGVDIDTRSDVYSLGVLLYELLTGERPFDLRHSSLDEMRRIIREVEPPRPSTRLSGLLQPRSHSEPLDSSSALAARDVKVATLAGASSVIDIARHRRTVPATLVRSLRGDLDWIVMKCLEKDRTRRYETANGLASDVQRHLSGEPVVAAPPSTWYRARKFVRRNKGAVLAGELVAAALIIGISVSTWMFLRERDARARAVDAEQTQGQLRMQAEADEKKAETEAAKSQQVAQFLKDMLKGVEPSVAMGRDTTMLREILDKTAERVDKDLADQPEVQIELRLALADIYHELGMFKRMEAMARGTLELARSNLGEENLAVADALVQLGDSLMHLRAYGESEAALREAIAMQRKLRGSESLQLAEALYALAHAIGPQGKDAETESVCREALAMRRRLLGNEHAKVARALDSLGNMLRHRGRLAEAESTMRESLAMRRNVLGNDHPDLGRSYSSLGALLIDQGRLGEAEAMYREALASQSTTPGQESWLNVWTSQGLANLLRRQGQLAEAEDLLRRGLPIARRQMGDEHSTTGKLVLDLADVLREEGKYAEAEILYRQLLPPERKTMVEDHSLVARAYNNLSDVLLALKRPEESEQALHEAITVLKRAMAEFPDQRQSFLEPQAHDYRILAFRYWNRRDYSGARELFAVATDLLRQSAEAGGPKAAATALQGEADNLLYIGQLWEAESRSAEANEAYRQALALHERIEEEERAQDIMAGWVANHYIQLAQLVEKVATREDALRIAQIMHAPKGELSAEALNGLVNCHFQLATVMQRHGSTQEAIQQLESLRGKLPADDTLSIRAEFNLASILRQGGELAEASQVCLQAAQKCHEVLPQYEKLAADRTRHHDCWSFAIAYEQIAQLLNELGQHEEAETGYRDAQVIWRKLAAEFNIEDDRWHLAVNHDALGHLLRNTGRLDEAADSYQEALAIWEKLASETTNVDRHNHLSWTRIALAGVLMGLGDNAAAEALATQLIQQAELTEDADLLADAYARAIPLLMINQQQEQARELGRKLLALTPKNGQPANVAAWFLATAENPACRDASMAVELANKAVELDPTRASWWNTLGAARYRAAELRPAIEAFGMSMELRQGGNPSDFFFLAMAHWQLGNDIEARTWYDKAVEWMDKNRPTNEELRRFRAEAAELIAERSPAHDSEHLEPPHE